MITIAGVDIMEDDEYHITHLLGKYGPALAPILVEVFEEAITQGQLPKIFRSLELHYVFHLKKVPEVARGKTRNTTGKNPTEQFLLRLRQELERSEVWAVSA
ncbi:MAG: hypothetical protein Q7T49_00630 [bacterium]|nr:hypothetical protein [bacterium]